MILNSIQITNIYITSSHVFVVWTFISYSRLNRRNKAKKSKYLLWKVVIGNFFSIVSGERSTNIR